jgi:hypothetical protein
MQRWFSTLLVLATFFASPCGATQSANNRTRHDQPRVGWVLEPLGLDQNDLPHFRVSLLAGSRRVLLLRDALGEFTVLDRELYERWDVPSTAITACLGSQPGAATSMYVIRRNRQLIVYIRDWDEQVDGTRYRRLRVIRLPR